MLTPLSDEELEKYQSAQKVYLQEVLCQVSATEANIPIKYLAGGSTLLEQNNQLILGLEPDTALYYQGNKIDIVGTALKYVNAPYLWGGRTVFGIDCSGFTQIIFKMNGIIMPRDAYQQAELGRTVHSIEDAQPGDLAFFENDKGRITHTGIILKDAKIIHSSGKVRIDKIDHKGIFNIERQEYSHKLTKINRFL